VIVTVVMIAFTILAQCWPGLLLGGSRSDRETMAVAKALFCRLVSLNRVRTV